MLAAATLLSVGCGGGAGDLLAIEVSGPLAAGTERIVVASDGRASCNGGPLLAISSAALIEAREIERSVTALAERGAGFDSHRLGARRYLLRTRAGAVRWGEGGGGLPASLAQAARLALQLGRALCQR